MARFAPGPVVLDNSRGTLQLCKKCTIHNSKGSFDFCGVFLFFKCWMPLQNDERSTETGNKLVGILLIQTTFLISMISRCVGPVQYPLNLSRDQIKKLICLTKRILRLITQIMTWESVYCKAIVLSPVGDEARWAMFEQHQWSHALPETDLLCDLGPVITTSDQKSISIFYRRPYIDIIDNHSIISFQS